MRIFLAHFEAKRAKNHTAMTHWTHWTRANSGQNSGQKITATSKSTEKQKKGRVAKERELKKTSRKPKKGFSYSPFCFKLNV